MHTKITLFLSVLLMDIVVPQSNTVLPGREFPPVVPPEVSTFFFSLLNVFILIEGLRAEGVICDIAWKAL